MNDSGWSHLARSGRRVLRTPLLGLHVLLGILVAAALGIGGDRHYRSTAPLVWWSRGLCWILEVRLQVSGTPHVGATLFVANHISWLDIFCIAAVCPTHFLAKQAVAAWPLFGWLCRRAGTVFIRRGGAGGASEATEQLARRLSQGERVLMFPEGTSTTGESVRRFHPRLFKAAMLARCSMQAIALHYPHAQGTNPSVPFVGDAALLPHLWRLLGEPPIHVELHFGQVHDSSYFSRDVLARQAHQEICHFLAIVVARNGAKRDGGCG